MKDRVTMRAGAGGGSRENIFDLIADIFAALQGRLDSLELAAAKKRGGKAPAVTIGQAAPLPLTVFDLERLEIREITIGDQTFQAIAIRGQNGSDPKA